MSYKDTTNWDDSSINIVARDNYDASRGSTKINNYDPTHSWDEDCDEDDNSRICETTIPKPFEDDRSDWCQQDLDPILSDNEDESDTVKYSIKPIILSSVEFEETNEQVMEELKNDTENNKIKGFLNWSLGNNKEFYSFPIEKEIKIKSYSLGKNKKINKKNSVTFQISTLKHNIMIDNPIVTSKKPEFCMYYIKGKQCTVKNCKYAHSLEELGSTPKKEKSSPTTVQINNITNISINPSSSSPSPVKGLCTKMCKSVALGIKCKYMTKCTYAHSVEELKIVNCSFGNKCKNGSTCKFKHLTESKEEYVARMK